MLRLTNTRLKRLTLFLSFVLVAGVLGACATQPSPTASGPSGFWLGIFHGLTIVFSLISTLFTDYRIYAFPKSGGWYDLGYCLGAASAFGGAGASARLIAA
jgi:hypothetical protein